MAFDPGRVRIVLHCVDGAVTDTAVSCARPELARLLRGRAAGQAVAMVPLLYSLCGRAQGIAARAALAAARGTATQSHVDAAVWAEAAREHAWKMFVDWPGQLDIAPDEAFFVRLMKKLPEDRDELAEAFATHELPERLAGAAGTSPMADLFRRRVRQRIDALHDWLHHRPGSLGTVGASCLAPGVGEATVETARGPLVHGLALDGDKIADYRIVAPTDVHFAVDGNAAEWLAKLCGISLREAEQQAKWVALTFDPCVPWVCEVA